MQGSFEKKVQEKLDELKLTPSAPVWDSIKSQITPEKRRRRGALWIPFIIVMLAGGTWWMWQQKEEAPVAGTSAPANSTPSNGQNNQQQPPVTEHKPGNDAGNVVPELSIGENERVVAQARKGQRKDSKEIIASIRLPLRKPVINRIGEQRAAGLPHQQQKTERSIEQLLNEKMPNLAIRESSTDIQKKEALPVDTAVLTDFPDGKLQKPEPADSIAAKPKIAAASRKWKPFVTLQAGLSRSTGNQTTVPNYYASPVQNAGGSYAGPIVNSSGTRGGVGYAVGVGMAKPLNQRLQVSIGLQYTYWRTYTKVGGYKPLDTTLAFQSRMFDVGGYYQNGNQQDYTTNYHLLELPVSLDYKLIGSVPLFLSAGASYGRLLQSNALTYDRNANIFYENDKNLSRSQFNLFSALQYGVINKKGFRFSAGPSVQYQLKPLQSQNGSTTQRLYFVGLKSTLQF